MKLTARLGPDIVVTARPQVPADGRVIGFPDAIWGRQRGGSRLIWTPLSDVSGPTLLNRVHLVVREAQHVAAYINAQERPAYEGKGEDYPGGAPVDAVYYPRYPENPLRAKLQAASTALR